jgi:hypothetical protein
MSVDLPSSTLPAVVNRSKSLACSAARKSSIWKATAPSAIAAVLSAQGAACPSSRAGITLTPPSVVRDSTSEISLALLDLHGAFLIVIDHSVLALRPAK